MKVFIVLVSAMALASSSPQFGNFNPLGKASEAAKGAVSKATSAVGGQDILNKLSDIGNKLDGSRSEVEGFFDNSWGTFKDGLQKTYSTVAESDLRKEIFINNIQKVKSLGDNLPFATKLNDFADMLHHEFHSKFNGFGRGVTPTKPIEKGEEFKKSDAGAVPDSIDWREKGAVTPVKFQNACAGCYAFAAAGALEAQQFKKTGTLKELSIQNIIDCSREYGNDGCQGGFMIPAFQYVKDTAGLNGEESYPFEAKNGSCRYNKDSTIARNSGFVSIPRGDEEALKVAVGTVGPVTAAIDASPESFQFYGDGVYFDPACKSDVRSLNHAVLVVGYGAEADGKKYWLVKNSYGPKWGLDGYIKMARDEKNHCGIATFASYPVLA